MIISCVLLFLVLAYVALFISTVLNYQRSKYMDGSLRRAEEKIELLMKSHKISDEITEGLYKEYLSITEVLKKIAQAIDILKLSDTPAIQKTVLKVLLSEEVMTPREVNLYFLSILSGEYSHIKSNIKDRVALIEKSEDIEQFNSLIYELDTMINLIETISKESSDEYINQIFSEIILCNKKLSDI